MYSLNPDPLACRTTLVGVAAAVAVLGACGEAPERIPGRPRLHLEEEFAIPIGDSAPLIGVVAQDAGRIVAWSQTGAYLLSATEPPKVMPVTFSGAPAGAGLRAEGITEFVDPAAALLRRSSSSREDAPVALPAGLRVLDGVRTDEFGWVLAGIDADGQYNIQPLDGASWWVVRPDTLRGGVLPPYRLAATGDGVLLTEAEPPFRTWRVRSGGRSDPFAPTGAGYPESSGVQRWVSGPVVDLGEGLVQTLSDLASDRRVMVLYDRDGREMRKTAVGIPMALVGITLDRKHLVAVRDMGSPEVVLYRWRWESSYNQGAVR
jgi:hypothetical protein